MEFKHRVEFINPETGKKQQKTFSDPFDADKFQEEMEEMFPFTDIENKVVLV